MLSARLVKFLLVLALVAAVSLRTADAALVRYTPKAPKPRQIFSRKADRRAGNSPGALKNFLEQSSVGVVVFDSHTAKYDDVPPLPFVILSGTASLAVVNPEWNPEILKQFEVDSVPSYWIYQNGKHVASLPGNNLIRLFNTLDTFTDTLAQSRAPIAAIDVLSAVKGVEPRVNQVFLCSGAVRWLRAQLETLGGRRSVEYECRGAILAGKRTTAEAEEIMADGHRVMDDAQESMGHG
ncbi:hypothetical protein B0J13DRAFT_519754 [Dactylonectria estremocensis]|uniref:Thioredoxin domain-containing protein n=1 Tax=Dactylonectria estremocensis TaxID=1079267 RepID=A0A9P9FEH0_9HYPO|nr:hypothetical protein B0J13DRAFT_519754 [Dactylonectria estremocensis]